MTRASSSARSKSSRATSRRGASTPFSYVESQVLSNYELTSMVFQFIRPPNSAIEQGQTPFPGPPDQLPAGLARELVGLVTVNRAFFHAGIEVLWENMNTLTPLFGGVLRADKDRNGDVIVPLCYLKTKITAHEWGRFTLYSSKIKTLSITKAQSTLINPGWLSHLINATDRPSVLFPGLRDLYTDFANPLALFVTSNATPNVRRLHLYLKDKSNDGVESAKALVAGLPQVATALTHLSLVHPVTASIVKNVGLISGLTSLFITVGFDVEKLKLSRLTQLRSLSELHIDQKLDSNDQNIASTFPSSVDLRKVLSQQPSLTIKTLRVKANGTTQYNVAAALVPQGLTALDIEVIPDILNTQMVLIPLVLTVYARLNEGLTTLKVYARQGVTANSNALHPLRSNPVYTGHTSFINALSGLRKLESLKIVWIPFLSADLHCQLLGIARRFPHLRTLALLPQGITHLEADDPIVPTLGDLEDTARDNQCLRDLDTAVDLTTGHVPVLPDDFRSTHCLSSLALSTETEWELAEFDTEQKFALARYLHTLFPQAKMDTSVWVDGDPSKEFWGFVDHALSFAKATRAQALRDRACAVM